MNDYQRTKLRSLDRDLLDLRHSMYERRTFGAELTDSFRADLKHYEQELRDAIDVLDDVLAKEGR